MGAAAKTLAVAIALAPSLAAAAPCLGETDSGERFPICFDTGNRLFVSGGTAGFGGGIRLRHSMRFDDEPDLTWKLEHRLLEGTAMGLHREIDAALYRGRFLRHARDGHLILPLGLPKKIFLPFDVGAEAAVGQVSLEPGAGALDLGLVRVAGLIDWSRTASFRRRLAVGVLARWDLGVSGDTGEPAIGEHRVTPLSALTASAAFESKDGLTLGSAAIEAGRQFSTVSGWSFRARAVIEAERTLIAINDRPLSIHVEASARAPDAELRVGINARIAILAKTAR